MRPLPKRYPVVSLLDGRESRPSVVIDHTAFPHILEAIIGYAAIDALGLVALRGVSHKLRDWADARLSRHIVIRQDCSQCSLPANPSMVPSNALLEDHKSSSSSLGHPRDAGSSTSTAQSLCIHADSSATTLPDRRSVPTIYTDQEQCVCPPSIARVEMSASGARTRQLPPMHLRSTEYPLGPSELNLPPTTTGWLRHGDEILKSATTIDIAADDSQLDLIVPRLTLPLRTVRLVENGSCPIFPGRIRAETAVIFTRLGPFDFYREGVAVPVDSEVDRIVMMVLPPILPDLGDRKDTRICWPLPPVNCSEVVYIFDPSWRTSTTQLPGPRRLTRDGGYLDAAIHYAAQSLESTRFVFVGVEALPIKGLVMRSKYISELRQWYRRLNPRTMTRLRTLAFQILGERVLFPDEDTLCWIRRLFLLQLPEDLSVQEVRLRMERAERDDLGGVEAERLARQGTQIRDTIRERCRGTMIYIRDSPIEPVLDVFRPVSQWPDERIDALVDEHLVFYSYEEYRQKVDEDEWRLWTMEPRSLNVL